MKKILGTVILLALGVFMVLGGIGQTTTDEVTCGGQVMAPGDICQEIRNGSTTEYTYDEQKENDRNSGWVLVGIGGVLTAIGLATGVATVVGRNRRAPAPAPVPAPYPAPQPGPYPGPYQGGPAPYPAPNGGPARQPHPGAGAAPTQYPHR
ncbi:hypothetical protein [Pseudonocardia lacus]|uniref:hypothetical protein n=1 Tax=Pseudonocardia lacus TaxID=2835865 RepID=UPI001BDCA7C7|nr:hypothetical protein [Pseudonocardia lacus]